MLYLKSGGFPLPSDTYNNTHNDRSHQETAHRLRQKQSPEICGAGSPSQGLTLDGVTRKEASAPRGGGIKEAAPSASVASGPGMPRRQGVEPLSEPRKALFARAGFLSRERADQILRSPFLFLPLPVQTAWYGFQNASCAREKARCRIRCQKE